MKICHNCGRELRDTVKNCVRCNEEQFDDAVIFKSDPKPPPEVKIRKPAQPQPTPTDLPQQQPPAQEGVPPYQQPNEPVAPQQEPFVAPQQEPFVAPQQEPFVAPQQEPFVAPQQEPFVAPQQEPFVAPHQEPFVAPQQEPFVAPQQEPTATNEVVANENTTEAIPFNSVTEQPQENPATEQNPFQYVAEPESVNGENVIDVVATDVEVDETVLNTIIEDELAKEPEPKKTSVSVLILFILLFVITILIVQPFLLDKLAPKKTNITVTEPAFATPAVTPAETPASTDEVVTTLPASLPYNQFVEGEYLGKATSELEAFYSSQTDTDIETANNRTIYNTDYTIIVDTADDLTTISNVAFLSEQTLELSTNIDATNTEATNITTIEDNIASITKVYELFKLSGTPIAINSSNENVIIDLATISVSDFNTTTFEPKTYEAIFKLNDAKVNIGASYTLENGIYYVSQSVIFSNFTNAIVEGDGTSPAISIPELVTEHPESEVVTSATP